MRSAHSTIQLSTKTFGSRDPRYLTEGDRRAVAASAPTLAPGPVDAVAAAYARGRSEERADVVASIREAAKTYDPVNEQGIAITLDELAGTLESGWHEGSAES